MAIIGSIAIALGLDSAKFEKGVKNARISMERFANKSVKKLKQFRRSVNRSLNPIKKLTALLTALASIATIKMLSDQFISAASAAEQYRIRLSVLLGSVREGNRMFDEMAKLAGRVPFTYEKIMASATQLSGIMKGGVDEVKQWMPLIADLAAATGIGIEKTTEQVSRMLSSGAASADMFRERGVTAMLGFQSGVAVSAEETKRRLLEAWHDTNSKFKGATIKLASSWEGMLSMMDDKWFQFRNKVMDAGLFSYIKGIATIIDEEMGKGLTENSTVAMAWSNNIISMIDSVIRSVGFLADVFRGLNVVWKGLEVAFAAVAEGILQGVAKVDSGITKFVNKFSSLTGKSVEENSFIQDWADNASARLTILKAEFDELINKPMPSTNFEEWANRIQAKQAEIQAAIDMANSAQGNGTGAEDADEPGNVINLEIERQKRLTAAIYEESQIRLGIEQDITNKTNAMKKSAMQNAVGLLQALGAKSKSAAIAALVLQKGLMIGETIASTAAASMRAMAELGPIAGPPAVAGIKAMGAANIGLIAATGLVQAGNIGGGGAAPGTAANPISTTSDELFAPQGQPVQQVQEINVYVQRGLNDHETIVELMKEIQEQTNDGVVFNVQVA